MNDDDKNFDKNLTRVMIGGAVLINVLAFAVGYDAGHKAANKQAQPPTIIHGDLTINTTAIILASRHPSKSKRLAF